MIINRSEMVAIIRKKTFVRIEARQTNTMETPNSRKVYDVDEILGEYKSEISII